MRMDHALAVAAGQTPGPDQILVVAGRLTRDADPAAALPAARGPGGMNALPPPEGAPGGAPDNLGTIRACHGLLSHTLRLLG